MSKYTVEQERAVNHDNGNILVSASAGSGKTYVMISRIIRLILEKKARVDDVLAVTFTSLAAAEMKEKLSKALIDAIIETDDTALKEQLKILPAANISTIHSFCANLLRTYFYKADIDANFEILDENDAIYLKNEAINQIFEQKYEESDSDFLLLVAEFLRSRKDYFLKELIINTYDKAMSWHEPIKVLCNSLSIYQGSGFDGILNELRARQKEKLSILYQDFLQLKTDLSFFEENSQTQFLNSAVFYIEEKLKADTFDGYFLMSDISFLGSAPKLKKSGEEHLTELHTQLLDYKKELVDLLKDEQTFYKNFDYKNQKKLFLRSGETSERLVKLLTEFIEKYSALKEKENKLDYDDLQHKSLALLSDSSILKSVKERFTYIFADEYQDVNDVQEQLLNLLSSDNLFMVGDLKQSIYAFRGCNPEFFAKKYQSYFGGEGKAERLNCNFRSSDGVINGVNRIFNRIMTESLSGIDYKNEAQLLRGGLYPECEGKAAYHIIEDDCPKKADISPKVYDLLEDIKNCNSKESENDSYVITKIILEEYHKQFYDIKSGENREIEFSDIVILAATRKKFESITNRLMSAGIPVTSDSSEDILSYPEIRLLVNVLELIDCAKQDLPLLSAMKNLGGFCEDEMSEIRLNTSERFYFDCCAEYAEKFDNAISAKLKSLFEYIKKLRLLAEFYNAGDLLNKIIVENKLDLYYLSRPFGNLKIKRIERFLKETTSGTKKLNCKEFLKKITDMTKPVAVNLSSGENTVKLMTIHASKGLEFPVVIVADCGKQFNITEENSAVITDSRYGFVTKAYDLDNMLENETVLRKLVKTSMRLTLPQDEMRLFYVALTRAKYNLHIVTSSKPQISNSLYNIKTALHFSDFVKCGEIETFYYKTSDFSTENEEKTPKNIIIGKPDYALAEDIKQHLNSRYKHLSSVYLPAKSSVTALLSDDGYYKTTDLFGESSAEKGTAYHLFLQYASFDGLNARSQLDNMMTEGKLGENDLKLLDPDKIDKILNNPYFKTFTGKKLMREQEFLIKIEANKIFETDSPDLLLVQGVIDLLVIGENGFEIVDYKLSTIERQEDIIKKYQKQLYLYRYAAEKILNIKADKLTILNILSESVINIDLKGQI